MVYLEERGAELMDFALKFVTNVVQLVDCFVLLLELLLKPEIINR